MLPKDIHPFWWYDRAKVNITLENQSSQAIILDLALVKGKGRPKGSRGNKKGAGSTSMYNLFSLALIT